MLETIEIKVNECSLREKCPYSDFSGLYFPAFGLNLEIYRNLRIQSKCKKVRTRKTTNTDTFYAVIISEEFINLVSFKICVEQLHFFENSDFFAGK